MTLDDFITTRVGNPARPAEGQRLAANAERSPGQPGTNFASFGQALNQARSPEPRPGSPTTTTLAALTAAPDRPASLPSPSAMQATVAPGDTLTSLVKSHAQALSVQLSPSEAMQWARQVAKDNKIVNANRIFPGQQLNLSGLPAALGSRLVQPAPSVPRAPWAQAPLTPLTALTPLTPLAFQAPTAAPRPVNTPPLSTAVVQPPAFMASSPWSHAPQAGLPAASTSDWINARHDISSEDVGLQASDLPGLRGLGRPAVAAPAALAVLTAPAAPVVQVFKSVVDEAASKPVQSSQAAAPAQEVKPVTFTPSRHEVLEKTLSRAVAKGFIPAREKADVRDKILDLAKTHLFNPDDFARMTLMESDGMNPRASNQRCHGIIQFCDGVDRGAASVGFSRNPRAILGMSVYQQLHLVDKYFDDVGLKNKGPSGLDDLYLSVLMPSARAETRPDAPLNVNGSQARSLYEGRDKASPMTRQSILQGLLKNAAERLGQPIETKGRLQATRTAAYDELAQQADSRNVQLR